jgi:hypothetical protein
MSWLNIQRVSPYVRNSISLVMSWRERILRISRHPLRAIRSGTTLFRREEGNDPSQAVDQSTECSAHSSDRQGKQIVTRLWNTLHPPAPTDMTRVFIDYETVDQQSASDAIEDGEFILRFVTSAGATLTVTETDDGQYLCRHETPSSLLTRSHCEHYQLSARSWPELEDTLLPLLALGWKLDVFTANRTKQWRTDRTQNRQY